MKKKNKSHASDKSTQKQQNNVVIEATNLFTLPSPFVVAIGASAGGLETLKTLFMPSIANANIAFVIITHLSSNHVSVLPKLIQKFTPIPVLSIVDRQKIEANHIYVLPAGKNVAIHHEFLELSEKKPGSDTKLPIDFFLCSLANEFGPKAICIILSGMGSDGTIGLRALKEKRGLIIAQTVSSARYDSMPKSAISTGLVDYVLLPEDMYTFLLRYIAHFYDEKILMGDTLSNELLQILMLLKNQSGHDFSLYKPNTIYRRIQKRMDILQISSLSTYVHYIYQIPSELMILFNELLINVTSFFRDADPFELLKHVILNKIMVNRSTDTPIRVWVPGCSTGEEAYSIAILLKECMNSLNRYFKIQIFGTDVDEEAIETARAGIFPLRIEKDVSQDRLKKFFTHEGDTYKVNVDIRKMIIFAVQNIIKDPPFTKLDILSCRNLLIYFKAQLQKQIIPLFHYSLLPQGILFLGSSENIGSSLDYFNTIDKRLKIYERSNKKASFQSTREITTTGQMTKTTGIKKTGKYMLENEPTLSSLVKNILLKNYAPACVVIDEQGNIVYIYGRTGRLLEFASGEVRLQLIDMIREKIKSKLQTAINKATEKQKEITLNNLQLQDDDDESHYINVKIRPLIEASAIRRNLMLIIFEEISKIYSTKIDKERSTQTGGSGKKLTQLEQELKHTKENLQTTIEELETANEELKSSNEELQSTNEELQSTNEEIETSKEELQSLNEELTTVNVELEYRIEQLSKANDDIKNLLDNTTIATIFLDKELCIKRYTPKATEIINLIPTDVGRPISHIVSKLNYDKLVEDARTVLRTLEPISIESTDKNGYWYAIKIYPYRTLKEVVDGLVVTFLNIHAQKLAENKVGLLKHDLNLIKNFDHTLINNISDPTIIMDLHGNIILANQHFLERYNFKNEEIMGYSIYELKPEWGTQLLSDLIKQLIQDKSLVKTTTIEMLPGKKINVVAHQLSSSTILLSLTSSLS
jgi:two-component system CheB/CheR fusion protein